MDIEGLETMAVGAPAGATDTGLAVLGALDGPDREGTAEKAGSVRRALEEVARHVGTDSERALATARLLEAALVVAGHRDDETCPVCATPAVLGTDWASASHGEITVFATMPVPPRRPLPGWSPPSGPPGR